MRLKYQPSGKHMRVPKAIYRRKVIPLNIYSIDILETATESLTEPGHNVEIDEVVKQFNAVDII